MANSTTFSKKNPGTKAPGTKSKKLNFVDQFSTLKTFFRISSIKHHLVMEDCKRFKPTNAVSNNQLMFT